MRSTRKILTAAVLTMVTMFASACTSDATHAAAGAVTVKVLMIGYPDQDSIDPTTGASVPGIERLKKNFEAAHPDINLDIINIPWGSGATGYAPKTDAMVQANEACVYEMPAALSYGHRGKLVDLNTLIAKDPSFKNVWGTQLDRAASPGPNGAKNLWYLPDNTGERVVNWDATIFKDYGVEPLSAHPTLQEIQDKAARLTGIDPVTGKQTYGYYYQGKYAVWQFLTIAHAMGANWGTVNADGTVEVNWNTPQYLAALQWFVKMAKYAPKGALGSDGMPQGFLSDQNVVAIIPEGEAGYFLQPLISQTSLRDRFRVSYNLVGTDGVGGVNTTSPLTMAASCRNKDAAWTAMKWLAGSADAEQYYFQAAGRLPTTTDGGKAVPTIASLPDGSIILDQPQHAEALYPWAADQPRWSLQTALEKALAGTVSPDQALAQAQQETQDWLSKQGTGQ